MSVLNSTGRQLQSLGFRDFAAFIWGTSRALDDVFRGAVTAVATDRHD